MSSFSSLLEIVLRWGSKMLHLPSRLEQNPRLKIVLYSIYYTIIVAIFAYLVKLAGKIEIKNIQFSFIILCIISVILLRIVSIYRMVYLLRFSYPHLTISRIWKAQATAILLGLFTPGKIGESAIILLGQGRTDRIHIASMFAFCKLLDGLVYIPFALLFAMTYHTYLKFTLIFLGLFAAALYIYLKANAVLDVDRRGLKLHSLYLLTAASLVLQVTGLYFVLLSKDISVPVITITMIWSVASIVALLSTLPGGIGVREAGISFLIASFLNVDPTTAISVSLLHGFLLYATTFLFTMISQFMLRRHTSMGADSSPHPEKTSQKIA